MKWLVFAGRRSSDLGMVPGICGSSSSPSSPPPPSPPPPSSPPPSTPSPPPASFSFSSSFCATNSLFESRERGYIVNICALEWHG